MKLSEQGLEHLIEVEGFCNEAYRDVKGLATIGVGHLLTDKELESGEIKIGNDYVSTDSCLSDKQVKQLLAQDVKRFEDAVNESVKVPLEQHQFDALVSFAFNIGVAGFKRSNALKWLNQGRYELVPRGFLGWLKPKVLKNRRLKEIALWRSNDERNQCT